MALTPDARAELGLQVELEKGLAGVSGKPPDYAQKLRIFVSSRLKKEKRALIASLIDVSGPSLIALAFDLCRYQQHRPLRLRRFLGIEL